jgi:glycosyltransferase involved in cell wall biosynthesis
MVLPSGHRPVSQRSLSVVLPVYNEESTVEHAYERLRAVLDGIDLDWWELIFSVDPSTDRTEDLILALRARDPRVKMLRFSRRFGQPSATIAGMEAAGGDGVVVMDCDLQDPPELLTALVARWREGYDVVYAQRRTRAGESLAKRLWAAMAYKVINHIAEVEIPQNTGDFRLMSERVVNNVTSLQETHTFLRGLVPLVGFRQTGVLYDRDPRAGGHTHYGFTGSWSHGLAGVVGFSRYPLQVIAVGGVALSGLAFLLAFGYLVLKLAGVAFPLGNPTIVIVVSFFSGIQLLSLGVIGEYTGRIFDEARRRPRYIIESSYGWEDNEAGADMPGQASAGVSSVSGGRQ